MLKILNKLYCLSDKEKPNIIRSAVYGLIYSAFELLQFYAVYCILRAIALNTGKNLIVKVFCIMLVSITGCIVMHMQSNIRQMHAGMFMAADKRMEIGDHLRYAAMGFFSDSSLGKISAAVSSKLYLVENTVPSLLNNVIQGIAYTTILVLGFTVFQWKIGLIMMATCILYYVIIHCMFEATKKAAPRKQKALTKLVENVLEYIHGIVIIRSFQDENDSLSQKMKKVLKENCQSDISYEKKLLPYKMLSNLEVKCGTVIAITVSVLMYLNGSIEIYESALAVIWLFVAFNQMELAGSMITILQNLDTAVDDINENGNPPIMESGEVRFVGDNCDIEIKDISFSYSKKKVIDHVSLFIPEKTLTAIVGYSGSGKTTLCNLISRFWDVDEGEIRIGGRDIRDYRTDELLSNISIVFQNVYLFNDTVANNIRFGKPDATMEEIVEAAKKACCHDFIMNLPQQYDTVIGENGGFLSGGEKQRISIARAMIKDAPIVILDEATSSIDPENEQLIQNAIQELTKNKTVIMIAHRLNTVRNADQIVVMNGGKVEQTGIHDQLIREDGIYSSLVNVRTKALGWKL